jgi:tetratricopeptide (TPR) repeat protein
VTFRAVPARAGGGEGWKRSHRQARIWLPGVVAHVAEPSGAPSGGAEPFVGRRAQLHRVATACEVLSRGQGCVVVVSGEPGIGKTRFCAEVAQRARSAGHRAVTVRCWLDGGAPWLWPWQAVVAELRGDGVVDLPGPDGASTETGELGTDRFARFVAVANQLTLACAEGPVCLVIDDLHGADAGTLLLVRFVVQSLPTMPLALILACRSDEPAGHTPEARLLDAIRADATSISLSGFDLGETTDFLAQHGLHTPDADLTSALQRLTKGHPLFLHRIVQTIRTAHPQPAAPDGLHTAIEQALAALSLSAQRILSLASILGSAPMVIEAAQLAGGDTVSVLDAVKEGEEAGLVTMSGEWRFAFSHDLVRTVVENRLCTADRLEAHARAAALVAPGDLESLTADRLARAAHHARSAARRSADDARRAVSICQVAAKAMVRTLAYEQADMLLSTAIELHTSALLGPPSARLTMQWAQAADLRGYRATARRRYSTAAERAVTEGDPVLVAEAALGHGGAWLDEHPSPVEKARMVGLQRRALAALSPDDEQHHSLRCRLVTRLAAQDVFEGGAIGPLHEAVEAVRRSGDVHALAEALAAAHHALFVPEHSRTRLALADELVELASESDQDMLSLTGLLWRTIDLIHLGDPQATRALEVLRERTTALGNDYVLYNVAIVDVMRLIRTGQLEEAEAAAERCWQRGEQIGRIDPRAYFAAQLAVIRWLQGRDAEMLDHVEELTASPALGDIEFSFYATAAVLAARADDHERSRGILDAFIPDKLADLVPSGTWTVGIVALVETAAALADRDLAAQAYDLLLPYAELPAIAGLGIVCLGSTDRALGVAASTIGERDRAVEHLERALAANERLGNRPLVAITRGNLAAALASGAGTRVDRERAAALLDQAIAEGTAMGLTGRVDAWQADLQSLRATPSPASRAGARGPGGRGGPARPSGPGGRRRDPGPTRRGVIHQDGRHWVIEVDGRAARVGALVGMAYLAELLTHPGRRIAALTLAAGTASDEPARHEVLDDQARNAYAARAREVGEDLAEAEAANDLARAEKLRTELDTLVDEIETASGLHRRPRYFPDDHERARSAVTKAVKRAIATIEATEPAIARELRDTVSTGASCSYTPKRHDPITWSARRA